jgi:hypothetical protein
MTAGVSGFSSLRVGEDPKCDSGSRSLLGLSKDELRMRAISASARPFLMRCPRTSASEARMREAPRAADDSMEE